MDFKSPALIRLFKYLVSGGTAAVVDLGLLHVGIVLLGASRYLLSSAIAFVFAFVVSFVMQKYWTFQNTSHDNIHSQLAIYLTTALINLGINTVLMFLFVEYVHLNPLIAQIVVAGLIACGSFFVYRWIFKNV